MLFFICILFFPKGDFTNFKRFVSSLGVEDVTQLAKIRHGEYQLLFISPELLLKNLTWREVIRSASYMSKLIAFVVDEAHCITKWLVFFL